MVKKFVDSAKGLAHDAFQTWRRRKPHGLFINCKTEKRWMLHRSDCPHSGDTEWSASGGWGSLTKRTKFCAEDVTQLTALAKQKGAVLEHCRDCM